MDNSADKRRHRLTLEFDDAEALHRVLDHLGDCNTPVSLNWGTVETGGATYELWDGFATMAQTFPCADQTGHLPAAHHRWQECPTYHDEEQP